MSATRFEASRQGGATQVALIRETPARFPFGKAAREIVPFDDWFLELPPGGRGTVARLMQALADGEAGPDAAPLVTADASGALLHPALVARLAEPDAAVLGLPPTTRLALNIHTVGLIHQPDFRLETRWTQLGGVAVKATVTGAIIRHNGADHRLPDPLYSTLAAVSRVNVGGDEAARQEALASLRATMGDEAGRRIAADGIIGKLRLAYASGFSLTLKASAKGFDFDPVLFGRERLDEAREGATLDESADGLLPPAQAESFARSFRKGDGGRRTYLLDDGAILFLDPRLTAALAIVRTAQAGTADQRRAFARNPERAVAEAMRAAGEEPADAGSLFIETQQFSERVSGIDIWRKPVLPWIKPKPGSWLPETFGLRIGEGPDARMIEIAPERLAPARDAAEQALREERATFRFDDAEIPATQATHRALCDLAALVESGDVADHDVAGEEPPPEVRQRYFLQVRDNLEDVAYAPVGGEQGPAPDLPPAILPAALRSSPKPHQVEGFAWLAACWRSAMPGVMLADDMGLGKTFQALAFLAWIRREQPHPRPVLVVAPTGLLANWRAEIERHLDPGALGEIVNAYGAALGRMLDGAGRDIDGGASRIDVDGWAHAGVVLTTYETMRDYHLSFARLPFAAIIYDEVQKLKNPASQMTRAAKTLNARFQLAMTGTPVENRLQDLWSIFDLIHPGLRGVSLHPGDPEAAAADAGYFEDSARLATLFALLEEIRAKREKVLIFCESLAMQALLAHEIRRRFDLPHAVPRIHGGVTGDARQEAVDVFQHRAAGFDAMILSPKAGGVGLTLTAANHVVHLSRWWNPAVEDQATDRAYRIGQQRDVTVYLPQAVHPDPAIGPVSFDLKLHALMERKRVLSRGLLAPGEADGDAGALFDAVVVDGIEPAIEPAPVAAAAPASEPEPPVRSRLSLRPRPSAPPPAPPARSVPTWPARAVYEPDGLRDFAIFQKPIAGEQIALRDIRDPYACAGSGARARFVDFAAMLLNAAGRIDAVRLTSWDADSLELHRPETSQEQQRDLEARWRSRIGDKATLHHVQLSRRQDRSFHDREIRADTLSGRTLIWDLGKGIDGVMQRQMACRVNFTEE